tara:strand:+ start:1662 stop:2447 length:786 start_codon:yes stop_codon:yes gene_type:complete
MILVILICLQQFCCQPNNFANSIMTHNCEGLKEPPFQGTIFINSDIVTPEDFSTFVGLTYNGREERVMFDRRVDNWITIWPYLFPALFDDSLQIEIQVNPEFGNYQKAMIQAEKFAPIIGQLPTELRKDVKTVWIHRGNFPFGGGNNNLLIHTDYSSLNYEKQGILEETLIHEAAHTSLDEYHSNDSLWFIAQEKDCGFISSYAQEHPDREDIAESYLLYFAVKFRSGRISSDLKKKIQLSMPNRIKYFDDQNYNMYPVLK